MLQDITKELAQINVIIKNYIDNDILEFKDAERILAFYQKYQDREEFINYLSDNIFERPNELSKDLKDLQSENNLFLSYYHKEKCKFAKLDFYKLCDEHLTVYDNAFEESRKISTAAWRKYKEIDNRLDFPAYYSDEQIEEMWKEHAKRKAFSDKWCNDTRQKSEAYYNEKRRIANLAFFKINSLVMLLSCIDQIINTAKQDIDNILKKSVDTNE